MGEDFPVITFPTGFPAAAMSCGCTTVGAWLCHGDGGSCVYGSTTLEVYQGGLNNFLIGMMRSDNARVEVGVHWHAIGY